MAKFSGKKCRLLTVMTLTVFFFFVEIVVGYLTNSMALVADSFHMLGDIAALVISFLSIKVKHERHILILFMVFRINLIFTYLCLFTHSKIDVTKEMV